ncbi:MAG: hypothetical protein LAN62_13535 [Acidobacteriia bacterium]|nr:hypothetical protein [Terriglobia bacterium]
MAKFSLSTYALRLRNIEKRENVQLDKVLGESDFMEMFSEYLRQAAQTLSNDVENQRLLGVMQYEAKNRTSRGIIETGDYGFESDIYDIKRKSVSYRRKIHEAEMLPFYFAVVVPIGADEGLVILQRFKQFGIRRVLLADLERYFLPRLPGLKILMNPLIPEELVTEYLKNGRITKIRFIRFGISSDIANVFDTRKHTEEEGHMELVVAARRNSALPLGKRVSQVLTGKRDLNKLIELHEFPYDRVKLEVRYGQVHRTIDLAHLHRVRAYYDITEEVVLGTGGHPTLESLNQLAEGLTTQLSEALGWNKTK